MKPSSPPPDRSCWACLYVLYIYFQSGAYSCIELYRCYIIICLHSCFSLILDFSPLITGIRIPIWVWLIVGLKPIMNECSPAWQADRNTSCWSSRHALSTWLGHCVEDPGERESQLIGLKFFKFSCLYLKFIPETWTEPISGDWSVKRAARGWGFWQNLISDSLKHSCFFFFF